MYGYVYMTTNLINGKKYIGQHKCSKFDENYKGSGHAIKGAINKYGKANFSVEIIEKCETSFHLDDREAYWIIYYDAVNSDDFYNLKSHDYIDTGGVIHSNSSYIWINNGIENKLIPYSDLYKENYKGWYTGKFDVKDQSGKNKGRICVNNGIEDRTVLPSELDEYLTKGYVKGRIPCRWITKDGITKYIPESELDSYISEGWSVGRILKEESKGVQKGKIFVTNGIENTTISPEELDDYLQQGYWRGFVYHKSKKKKIWVNNGIEHTQINPEELDDYQKNGYSRGMLKRNKSLTRIYVNDGINTKHIFLSDLEKYLEKGFVEGRLNRPIKKNKKIFK